MLLVSLSVPIHADQVADGEILYGTPKIDGVVDSLYYSSLCVLLDEVGENCSIDEGMTFVLWDSKYIYFCAVSCEVPTESSAVAFYFRHRNCYESVVISASGEWKAATTEEESTFVAEDCRYQVQLYESYYVAELAVPFDEIESGMTIGFHTCYFDDYEAYSYSYGGLVFSSNYILSSLEATETSDTERSQIPTAPVSVTEGQAQSDGSAANDTTQETQDSGCQTVMDFDLTLWILLPCTVTVLLQTLRQYRKKHRCEK